VDDRDNIKSQNLRLVEGFPEQLHLIQHHNRCWFVMLSGCETTLTPLSAPTNKAHGGGGRADLASPGTGGFVMAPRDGCNLYQRTALRLAGEALGIGARRTLPR
jgi:hypothetical protein